MHAFSRRRLLTSATLSLGVPTLAHLLRLRAGATDSQRSRSTAVIFLMTGAGRPRYILEERGLIEELL